MIEILKAKNIWLKIS